MDKKLKTRCEDIYEALLDCVHRNMSDAEFVPAMLFLLHKTAWEITADNEVANAVVQMIVWEEADPMKDASVSET